METVTQTQRYAIDASHSSAEFVVRHLMITKVRGRFAAFAGTIDVPAGATTPSKVDVSIDVASIDTREAQRDTHLRSADFFDVERYPTITFTSKRFDGSGDTFDVIGDLTIHGVTREVTLSAEFQGRSGDPWGNERVGYSASTKINRKDFGLNWNAALETGGVMVSDEVKIELEVQATLQK